MYTGGSSVPRSRLISLSPWRACSHSTVWNSEPFIASNRSAPISGSKIDVASASSCRDNTWSATTTTTTKHTQKDAHKARSGSKGYRWVPSSMSSATCERERRNRRTAARCHPAPSGPRSDLTSIARRNSGIPSTLMHISRSAMARSTSGPRSGVLVTPVSGVAFRPPTGSLAELGGSMALIELANGSLTGRSVGGVCGDASAQGERVVSAIPRS